MRLLSVGFGLLLLGAAPPPGAAPSAVPSPQVMVVELRNFRFAPAALMLRAGVPVTLRLSNRSGGGHSFAAPAFFAAASIDPASATIIRGGRVEVPGHKSIDISLRPAAGTYILRCTHTLHSTFGMRGTILVR